MQGGQGWVIWGLVGCNRLNLFQDQLGGCARHPGERAKGMDLVFVLRIIGDWQLLMFRHMGSILQFAQSLSKSGSPEWGCGLLVALWWSCPWFFPRHRKGPVALLNAGAPCGSLSMPSLCTLFQLLMPGLCPCRGAVPAGSCWRRCVGRAQVGGEVLGRSPCSLVPCLGVKGVRGRSAQALLRPVQGPFKGRFWRELCLGRERPIFSPLEVPAETQPL